MSRTDKDRPYRIRSVDETYGLVEYHDHREVHVRCITGEHEVTEIRRSPWNDSGLIEYTRTERTHYNGSRPAVCDIDKPDTRRYVWSNNNCYRDNFHGGKRTIYYNYMCASPPAWFVKHIYHSPMRRDSRDVLRNAARDYNTYGDTDLDEDLTVLSESSAKWLWW